MTQPAEIDPSIDPGSPETSERPPVHGFQGNRAEVASGRRAPAATTVAISREAGARGGMISRLVGERLGWQVYDQELLEYMTQDGVVRQGLLDSLPDVCQSWFEQRLAEVTRRYRVKEDPALMHLAEVILALGSQGRVVLIGRGAGILLPRETTTSVRIVGPLEDRIAYMGQWLRLGRAEAAETVRSRDERRMAFLVQTFGIDPNDPHLYDLVLNSSWLGEEGTAELIAQVALRRETREPETLPPSDSA